MKSKWKKKSQQKTKSVKNFGKECHRIFQAETAMIAEIITSSVPFLAAKILATFHSAVCRFIRLPLFGCLYSATLSDENGFAG